MFFNLPFILIFYCLLHISLYANDVSQVWISSDHNYSHLTLSYEKAPPPIPKANNPSFSTSSSSQNSSRVALRKCFIDSQKMQSITWDEVQVICCNKTPDQLFNDFSYYANPYYFYVINQQQGYEDFILSLHEKYTGREKHKHKKRESLRCVKGFYPGQFLKLIDSEYDRIRRLQQEREQQKQVDLQKKLEAAKHHCLQVNNPNEYQIFIKHCEQEADYAQILINHDLNDRYQKRIAAAQKTSTNPRIYDYTAQLKSYPAWNDPDVTIFNNHIGTALDQQLHEELSDIRLHMHELSFTKSTLEYQQIYAPIVYRCTALAKQEKNLTMAFSLADFSDKVVRILSRGLQIISRASSGSVQGLKMLSQTATSSKYWAELITAVPNLIVNVLPMLLVQTPELLTKGMSFAMSKQSSWDSLDQAYMVGDYELLEKRCATFAQQNQKDLKPIAERMQQLASMSWEDLGKYGTYYGGRLILDVMACRAFSLAASATGREITSSIATLLESSRAPESLAEIAGIGKIAVGDGIETAYKVAEVVKNNQTISHQPNSIARVVQAESRELINETSKAILKNGYYEVNGFKFSERYYQKLWLTGRGAPSVVAKEVLEGGAATAVPDMIKNGFYKYVYGDWEMVYNPITKEVWHLQPTK